MVMDAVIREQQWLTWAGVLQRFGYNKEISKVVINGSDFKDLVLQDGSVKRIYNVVVALRPEAKKFHLI